MQHDPQHDDPWHLLAKRYNAVRPPPGMYSHMSPEGGRWLHEPGNLFTHSTSFAMQAFTALANHVIPLPAPGYRAVKSSYQEEYEKSALTVHLSGQNDVFAPVLRFYAFSTTFARIRLCIVYSTHFCPTIKSMVIATQHKPLHNASPRDIAKVIRLVQDGSCSSSPSDRLRQFQSYMQTHHGITMTTDPEDYVEPMRKQGLALPDNSVRWVFDPTAQRLELWLDYNFTEFQSGEPRDLAHFLANVIAATAA